MIAADVEVNLARDNERGVIGSILLDSDRIDDVADIVTPEDFEETIHALAFRECLGLQSKGHGIDPLTVAEAIVKAGHCGMDEAAAVIEAAIASVPHAAHAVFYATSVMEQSLRRQVIAAAGEVAGMAKQPNVDAEHAVAELDNHARRLSDRLAGTGNSSDLNVILRDALDLIERGQRHGLDTEFIDFDELTNGLQPGNMVVVAARPSMGKTAWICSVLHQVGSRGVGAVLFSLEQSRLEIMERLIALHTGIPVSAMRKGLNVEQKEQVLSMAGEIKAWPVWIDTDARSMVQIGARARRLKRKSKLQLVVIDYLQLIEPFDRREPRQQQVAGISRDIKRLAQDLGLPVIALAQLNRGVETRDIKRPRLSDLRESGAIEQDADLVAFLHRPGYYDEHCPQHEAELIVEKHRNGPTGLVRLNWSAELMSFRNSAKGAE